MNKYRERILRMGKETGARLILPEINDNRIQDARQELVSMGFQVLHHEDFEEKIEFYLDYVQNQPFTANWPEDSD